MSAVPAPPNLAPGMSMLQGRVLAWDGQPVAGATVTVLDTPALKDALARLATPARPQDLSSAFVTETAAYDLCALNELAYDLGVRAKQSLPAGEVDDTIVGA